MQAQTQRTENRLGVNEALYEDPSLASILVKVERGSGLDDVEQLRLERFYSSSFVKWESEYLQLKAGFLTEQDLPVDTFRQVLRTNPGMLEYWRDVREDLPPDFVEFIEGEGTSR